MFSCHLQLTFTQNHLFLCYATEMAAHLTASFTAHPLTALKA